MRLLRRNDNLKTTIFWQTFDVIIDVSVFDVVKGLRLRLICTMTKHFWSELQPLIRIYFPLFGIATFFQFKTETAFRLKIHLSSNNVKHCHHPTLLWCTLPLQALILGPHVYFSFSVSNVKRRYDIPVLSGKVMRVRSVTFCDPFILLNERGTDGDDSYPHDFNIRLCPHWSALWR